MTLIIIEFAMRNNLKLDGLTSKDLLFKFKKWKNEDKNNQSMCRWAFPGNRSCDKACG